MKTTLGKLNRGQQVTIVALGDSITHSTFHTRGHMNWLQLLEEGIFERYGNNMACIVNAGHCGGTAHEACSRLTRDVLRFQPDLVILSFGMNDAGAGETGLPGFRHDLQRLVYRVRERCAGDLLLRTPNPVIACNGLTPPGIPAGGIVQAGRYQQKRYARAIVDLAAELDCSVCDHYSAWEQAAFETRHPVANANGLWMRMSDAIHPGPLGHLAFYRELAPLFDLADRFPWE